MAQTTHFLLNKSFWPKKKKGIRQPGIHTSEQLFHSPSIIDGWPKTHGLVHTLIADQDMLHNSTTSDACSFFLFEPKEAEGGHSTYVWSFKPLKSRGKDFHPFKR